MRNAFSTIGACIKSIRAATGLSDAVVAAAARSCRLLEREGRRKSRRG
jgi:hypothetical protein